VPSSSLSNPLCLSRDDDDDDDDEASDDQLVTAHWLSGDLASCVAGLPASDEAEMAVGAVAATVAVDNESRN